MAAVSLNHDQITALEKAIQEREQLKNRVLHASETATRDLELFRNLDRDLQALEDRIEDMKRGVFDQYVAPIPTDDWESWSPSH